MTTLQFAILVTFIALNGWFWSVVVAKGLLLHMQKETDLILAVLGRLSLAQGFSFTVKKKDEAPKQ